MEIIYDILDWVYLHFPTVFIIGGCVFFLFHIIREIKEIFIDKGNENESLGTKLKYFIFFWLKRKEKIKDNVIYSDEERKEVIETLKKHNFFQEINLIKMETIPSLNFGDIRKNEVFRDIIRIYVDTIELSVIKILETYHLDKMKTNELNKLFTEKIDENTILIYSKMRTRLGNDLYNLVIEDPVMGFRTKNSIFREIFIRGVLNMSAQHMSMYGYDNYRRSTEILTSMYISLQVIVKNFGQVFKDFNGELNKYLK